MKKILMLLVIISYFFVIRGFGKIYRADLYYKDSQRQLALRKEEVAMEKIQNAIELNPDEPRYRLGESKIFLTNGSPSLKYRAVKDLKSAYSLNQKNLVTIRNAVPLYYLAAINDIYKKPGGENLDTEYIDVVKKFFMDTKQKYPNDVGVYVLIAGYEKRLGFNAEHKDSIEKIRKLRPDLLQWYGGIN